MCFAFRDTTSFEPHQLDDILTMVITTGTYNMHHKSPPPAPASAASTKEATDDCVMMEGLSVQAPCEVTKKQGSMQRSASMEDDENRGSEWNFRALEDRKHDEDGHEENEKSVASVSTSRKRSGSVMEKESAKKIKIAPVSKPRAPSGKGADYDDLRDRANKLVREKREEIVELTSTVSDLEKERDVLFLKVGSLERKEEARLIKKKSKEAKHEAELKAIQKDLRAVIEAEMNKKHKVAIERTKEKEAKALQAAKEAKALAKESNPETSSLLKASEKRIAQLEDDNEVLSQLADDLKKDKKKLKEDLTRMRQAYDSKGDDVHRMETTIEKLEGDIESGENELAALKKSHNDFRETQHQKWQIQHNNSQTNARRAADIQRTCSTATSALHECIKNRIELEDQIKVLEAENQNLREAQSTPKVESAHETVEGKAESDLKTQSAHETIEGKAESIPKPESAYEVAQA